MECKYCRFFTCTEGENGSRAMHCALRGLLSQEPQPCESFEDRTREKTLSHDVVEASKLHTSRILPQREVDEKLVEAIRREGIQYPIIVRESPYEKGMYEIIDGHIRYRSTKEDQRVLVEIRTGIDDLEVFRIGEATFTRIGRTTFERAMYYSNWTKAMESKHGKDGAQWRVAKEAHLSEANVSYYLSIGRLFERLNSDDVSREIAKALKIQSVNKLYELSKVEKDEVLLAAAGRLASSPEMTLNQLKSVIEEEIEAADPLRQIKEEEEDEAFKMNALKEATQQLEDTLESTRKTVSVLKSNVHNNARNYLTARALQRIEKMINALRRIGKEAESIANDRSINRVSL